MGNLKRKDFKDIYNLPIPRPSTFHQTRLEFVII